MYLSVLLDIGVAISFFLIILNCYRKGLVRTVIGLLSSVVSLVGAYLLGNGLSEVIYDNAIKDKIINSISTSVESNVSSTTSGVQSTTSNLPDFVNRILGYLGYSTDSINQSMNSTIHQQSTNVANGIESVLEPIITSLLAFVLIFVIFIILRFITGMLSKFICRAFDMPIISTINRIFGGVVGIVYALVLIYFLSGIIAYAIPIFSAGSISFSEFDQIANNSVLFSVFYNGNILTDSLNSVLSVFN